MDESLLSGGPTNSDSHSAGPLCARFLSSLAQCGGANTHPSIDRPFNSTSMQLNLIQSIPIQSNPDNPMQSNAMQLNAAMLAEQSKATQRQPARQAKWAGERASPMQSIIKLPACLASPCKLLAATGSSQHELARDYLAAQALPVRFEPAGRASNQLNGHSASSSLAAQIDLLSLIGARSLG